MTLRWGILSTARIGIRRFLPAVRAVGGEVVAISSRRESVTSVARDHAISRSYIGHAALLEDPDIDAVYIPLPNALHAEWIGRAAAAGKHVLCEKPIVGSREELDEASSACENAGVALMEGFMYRHHPQQARLRVLIGSGAVGELKALRGRFHFAIDRDREDIRFDPDLGGGSLNDVGCYPVDAIVSLLGQAPNSAQAAGHFERGVDTYTSGVLGFDNVAASFDCGFDGPLVNRLEVLGTGGRIELDKAFDPLPHEAATVTVWGRDDELVSRETFVTDQFADGIAAFQAWVKSGRRGLMDRELVEASLLTRAALHRSMAAPSPDADPRQTSIPMDRKVVT
ncbi:Gfo/Idh/MocA family protein [Arthrobacter sp. NPDC056691]|uniref:Gfo/Idh/MocA family protein n=1 Tax=Arthrobacter sp. NPDC056691 TaxID=3345913 RepID=UPI00366E867A